MDDIYKQLDYMAGRLTDMEQIMIDPKEFGELKGQFTALTHRVDDIARDVRALVELANQGKGGLWMFRSVYVAVGGVGVWLLGELAKLKGWK